MLSVSSKKSGCYTTSDNVYETLLDLNRSYRTT